AHLPAARSFPTRRSSDLQHNLPYLHVVVNNSYLGLIRQSQRAFDMDYEVSLAFENINASPEAKESGTAGYGVDHIKIAEGLGCKALRVEEPEQLGAAFEQARSLMDQYKVPVVVEVILERVTNIARGTALDNLKD